MSNISVVYSFLIGYGIVIFGMALVLYLLKAFAVYEMSKSAQLSRPWLAFIPIVNEYAFGRLAERYQKRDGTRSMRFGIVLPVLGVLTQVMAYTAIAMLIVVCFKTILSNIIIDEQLTEEMLLTLISDILPAIGILILAGIIATVYTVFYFIAYWRVTSIYDFANATLYTVLSIFFSFLMPIFLFIIRKREPKFTYSERMGQYTERF